MATGLEAFGHDGIDTGLLALLRKTGRRHDMRHENTVVMEKIGIKCRIPGRSKHDLYPFVDQNLHQPVHFGIHERDVHAKGSVGCRPTFHNMLAQRVGVHRPRTEQSQAAGIAHRRSQAPAAAPHHATLHDRIANAKQFTYTICHKKIFYSV